MMLSFLGGLVEAHLVEPHLPYLFKRVVGLLLIIISFFYMPSTLMASGENRVKANEVDVIQQAYTQAEKDVNSRIRKFGWCIMGVPSGCVYFSSFWYASSLIVGSLVFAVMAAEYGNLTAFFLSSASATLTLSLYLSDHYYFPNKLAPKLRYMESIPKDRLIGKSPEYIAAYTDHYKEFIIQQREHWLDMGQYVDFFGGVFCCLSGYAYFKSMVE